MDQDLIQAQKNVIGNRIWGRRFLRRVLFVPQKRHTREHSPHPFFPLLNGIVSTLDAWNSIAEENILIEIPFDVRRLIPWTLWRQTSANLPTSESPSRHAENEPAKTLASQGTYSRIVQFPPISTGGHYSTADIICCCPLRVNMNH